MPRQWRATIPKSSARIDLAAPNNAASLRAYSASRLRTIGARTSTCAHDTSPERNASPVASCLRVRRAMPTSFEAPTAVIGARCVSHVRGLNAPSSAQSARASQSPTERDDRGLETLRDLEQPDQLIRTGRARPLATVLGVDVLDRRRICSIGSSPNIRSILPKGYDSYQRVFMRWVEHHRAREHAGEDLAHGFLRSLRRGVEPEPEIGRRLGEIGVVLGRGVATAIGDLARLATTTFVPGGDGGDGWAEDHQVQRSRLDGVPATPRRRFRRCCPAPPW